MSSYIIRIFLSNLLPLLLQYTKHPQIYMPNLLAYLDAETLTFATYDTTKEQTSYKIIQNVDVVVLSNL